MYIEHKLPKGPFQPGEPLLQNDKARARKLCRGLKIHLAERFAEVEMLLGCEGIITPRPETMMLDVVFFVFAVGHFVQRQIGNFR